MDPKLSAAISATVPAVAAWAAFAGVQSVFGFDLGSALNMLVAVIGGGVGAAVHQHVRKVV